MKYLRKPGYSEAVQFDPNGVHRLELPKGVTGVHAPGADNWAYAGCTFFVTTIHGQQTKVVAGDYIVTEPDGIHHYPCKPDIFEERHDLNWKE
jgi:hypothetical protein